MNSTASGTNATYTVVLHGGSTTGSTDYSDDFNQTIGWLSDIVYSKKPIWEIEEETDEYRRMMLNVDRRYEGTKKSIRCRHYTRIARRYYHLFKHRSY